MSKLTSILQERFRKKEKPKMTALAEKTSEGNLTVFSGIFGVKTLDEKVQSALLSLLQKFAPEHSDISSDLSSLVSITAEVKGIQNQAAILHGERIKRAQEILKNYKEGAFSAWLITTYGNRQTPYNFLQYFEFYSQLPKHLHDQLEAMPRQAIYTLASREGDLIKKEEIVRNYNGQTKEQLISMIRNLFPLEETDQRRQRIGENAIKTLSSLLVQFQHSKEKLSKEQKRDLKKILTQLLEII